LNFGPLSWTLLGMCGRDAVGAAVVATFLLLVPGTGSAAAKGCAGADVVPVSAATIAQAQKAVACLVNVERKAAGRKPLKLNSKLRHSATDWAQRMDDEDFFAHTRSGSTAQKRIAATGYLKGARSFRVGENIGWGSGTLATPAARVRSWMSGGQHRKNILTADLRDIGVGIAGAPQDGVAEGAVYVLNFGRVTKR
jgi:uncharacterized protein YkwD